MNPDFLANYVIRPPRNLYTEFQVGIPLNRHVEGKDYNLSTFKIFNDRGQELSCSFMEPASEADRTGDTMPCVIYMHGNGGNKMEGLTYG